MYRYSSYYNQGKTAVHWAALQGKLESLKLLGAYNCDLKARVNKRGTALHYAAAHGEMELVEWLVEQGVDVASKDKNGRLPKDVAKRNGHTLVHQLLKEAERQSRVGDDAERRCWYTVMAEEQQW